MGGTSVRGVRKPLDIKGQPAASIVDPAVDGGQPGDALTPGVVEGSLVWALAPPMVRMRNAAVIRVAWDAVRTFTSSSFLGSGHSPD
jgi:hypothetical protein